MFKYHNYSIPHMNFDKRETYIDQTFIAIKSNKRNIDDLKILDVEYKQSEL